MNQENWRWFVLAVNPEPWAIGPVGYSRRGGKMSAYVGRNQQLDAYKQAIREELGNGHHPILGKFHLRCYFWRNQANYETIQARVHRKHEADVTNLTKATEDACQGILFDNDKDTNHIEGIMVEQGPNVIGKVVIAIRRNQGTPSVVAELPDSVCELLDQLDNPSPDTLSNEWPPKAGDHKPGFATPQSDWKNGWQ
jgi:hypothetical protein